MSFIYISGVSAGNNRAPEFQALSDSLEMDGILLDPEQYFNETEPTDKIEKMVWDLLQKTPQCFQDLLKQLDILRRMADYTADVYDVAFSRIAEPKIIKTLNSLVEEHNPTVLVGHSLGSVLAAHWLQKNEIDTLVTLGSPLWMPLIWHQLGMTQRALKRNTGKWVNYWSPIDPIACNGWSMTQANSNRMVMAGHDLVKYLPPVKKKYTSLI